MELSVNKVPTSYPMTSLFSTPLCSYRADEREARWSLVMMITRGVGKNELFFKVQTISSRLGFSF